MTISISTVSTTSSLSSLSFWPHVHRLLHHQSWNIAWYRPTQLVLTMKPRPFWKTHKHPHTHQPTHHDYLGLLKLPPKIGQRGKLIRRQKKLGRAFFFCIFSRLQTFSEICMLSIRSKLLYSKSASLAVEARLGL